MNKLSALVVCLMVCALFGLSFGQENDFRETTGTKKRDLPLNPETVKPCLDSTRFGSFFTVSSSYRGPKSLAAADFTGDGRQDIVAAASTDNRVVLFRNDDTSRWTSITLGTVNGASAVFAADLNADSRVDVVATSETDNTVYWFQNLGNNQWTQRTIATTAGAAPTSVFVADINGDNKLDVIMAGDLLVYVENQITNANLDGWSQTTVDYTGGHIDSVYAADINKDSFVDLVIASSVDNSIAWLNNTNGLGTAFVSIPIATPTGPVQVFCGDMDNDTWVDVVAVNNGENATALYYNNFVTNHTLPAGSNNSAAAESGWVGVYVDKQQNGPESVFLADLNGDGFQDIIVVESGNNTVRWYDSTTNQYTWAGNTVGSITNPTYVVARDINNNKAKDVVVASESKHTVGWFKELCATSPPSSSDDDHVVGWAVVGGVVGGLLILWILIAIVIAIRDYVKHQMDKAAEQRKREAKAMLPTAHEDL